MKNVFVIGLDEFNRKKLECLPEAEECRFLPALDYTEIRHVQHYDMEQLIRCARKRMKAEPGGVDAIVTYYDFPGTVMVPILAEEFGVIGPSLESVLKCEHKYWSRLEQQKVIAEHIPKFRAFDPSDEDAYHTIDLIPPFWIKPFKSFKSYLAFKVSDEYTFRTYSKVIQENLDFIQGPFSYLLETYGMPEEFVQMKESCIAESTLGGQMCTLEGYVYNEEVVIYGIVDSVRELDRSSFARYEYPSALPLEIQFRMIDIARRAINALGLTRSPFNIEFFYDPTFDRINLLEINPRISQAHTDIFEKVHSTSHHRIMLQIALGIKPKPMEYNGEYPVAANCMLRVYNPGRIIRVPDNQSIQQVEKEVPGSFVQVLVQEGQLLEDLQHQDSYSYHLANIYIGARHRMELVEKYNRCLELLPFEVEFQSDITASPDL